MELLDAKWELGRGRTVKFRIVDDPHAPLVVHPFAQFVRRRGGRKGTRFRAAFARYGEDEAFYTGEAMLMSGGNPLGQGMWVSFWLDDEADHHPFAGCTGRSSDKPGDLFAVAFVELDDEDRAVNQEKRERVERAHGRGGQLAKMAALFCQNELFFAWLSETVTFKDNALRSKEWWAEDEHAARWIRWMCGVESRADLDHNPRAEEIFHAKIRRPYLDWKGTSED